MIELKPCPFCGGKAKMKASWSASVYVECMSCFAQAMHFLPAADYCADDRAAEAWNRRTYQPEEIEREFMKLCEREMERDE